MLPGLSCGKALFAAATLCWKQCLPATQTSNIWSSRALTLSLKMQFCQCIVMSILAQIMQTWRRPNLVLMQT